jgi:DNA-binding MarR family transcriptional regulator
MTRETDDLIMRIERSEERITQRMIRDRSIGLFNVDLSVQQLRALMVVAASGGMSSNELAGALGVGATTVTGIVDRLERRGLTARLPDPADRRVRRVELTDEGRRLLTDFNESSRARRRALFAQLDPGVLAGLAEGFEAMERLIVAEDDVPPC